MRRFWQAWLALGLLTTPAMAGDDDLKRLLDAQTCPLTERLNALRANPAPADRFLIVAPRGLSADYVQCLVQPDGQHLLCEAASHAYAPSYAPPLSADAVSTLAKLGFNTEEKAGNYQRMIELTPQTAMQPVAQMLLTALHDAYGVKADSGLDIVAPLLPGTEKPVPACTPGR